MKLIIKSFNIIKGKEKEIELYLTKNIENKNEVIKDLINKFSKMEKEMKELKDDNIKMKQENIQLNQNIVNLKMEINSMKNNQNNEIVNLQNQIMNISNMMNQIQQKINEFNFLKEEINLIENQINLLSMPLQGFMSNSQLPIDPFNMGYNNNMEITKKKNNQKKSVYEEWYSGGLTVKFREADKEIVNVQCLPDEKVSDIIQKYRIKACNHNTDIKFIYNAKALNEDLTICENAIINNACIFVVQPKKLKDH